MIAYFLGGCSIYGIVLFVLVMLRPKSALHTKKLTDCGRREKITIGVVLVILILLCTLPMGLAPGWNGEDPGATNQYELVAEAILNGHINIDNGDVDPLLLQMDNPYDPQARVDLGVDYRWDTAYYHGHYYMYFGGLWGGQLQRYRNNKALESAILPEGEEEALPSRVVRLSDDMMEFAEEPRPLVILDENGKPLTAGDTERRFFEASWVHKYNGKYYFSYSTGDTHLLCYAIGDNPYGPFTYQGVILTPVVGWTTHHAIVEFKGKWYLFHHDCVPSEGKTWLRSLKVCELQYDADGKIITIEGLDE